MTPFPVTTCEACGEPIIKAGLTKLEPEPTTDHRANWRLTWRYGAPYAEADIADKDVFSPAGPGLFARKRYRLHTGQCFLNQKKTRIIKPCFPIKTE